MKGRLLIIISVISIFLCNCVKEESNNCVVVHGTIHDPNIQEVILSRWDIIDDETKTWLVEVDSTGYFIKSIPIDYHQGLMIMYKLDRFYHFLGFVGDTVFIEYKDTVINKSSSLYAELYTQFNEFYARFYPVTREFYNKYNYKIRPPSLYKEKVDSLANYLSSLVQQIDYPDTIFHELCQREINYWTATTLLDYDMLNGYFNKEIILPNGYYDILKKIEAYTHKSITTHNKMLFYNFLSAKYLSEQDVKMDLDEITNIPLPQFFDLLLTRHLYYSLSSDRYNYSQDEYKNALQMISNEYLRSETEKRVLTFRRPRELDSKVKLSDLSSRKGLDFLGEIYEKHRGYVVYLKFWSPGCAPCMESIPAAIKLEEKYSGYRFKLINVCTPYPKDIIKATIAEKNIGGIHYILSESQWKRCQEFLNCNGIPQYVLINTEGEIVDMDAPEPGTYMAYSLNQELCDKIDELLNIYYN